MFARTVSRSGVDRWVGACETRLRALRLDLEAAVSDWASASALKSERPITTPAGYAVAVWI